MSIAFWIIASLIVFTFIGYPISLVIIRVFIKRKKIVDTNYRPEITIIIPAYNEASVIKQKLENTFRINYPVELYKVIVASDNSSDDTNSIVREYMKKEPRLTLYEVANRGGKTNAQNEAVALASGEVIVFTDANAMIEADAVTELVSCMVDESVLYVSGRLVYSNKKETNSSFTESTYWNYDLMLRKLESDIQTITGGNGSLYAIKTDNYVFFEPKRSHDTNYPAFVASIGKRAVYNEKAISYEKAGESTADEFKRKRRMCMDLISKSFKYPSRYNFVRSGWYSYFYLCHRILRNSLFLFHIALLVLNILLLNSGIVYQITLLGQGIFYLVSVIGGFTNKKLKLLYLPHYYSMTMLAQLLGVFDEIFGRGKAFWEKAESTR